MANLAAIHNLGDGSFTFYLAFTELSFSIHLPFNES